jgi:hypothetical protein
LSKIKVGTPIIVNVGNGELFKVITNHKFYNWIYTSIFKVVKIESGCITLSALIPIDIEGCPIDLCEELYSLLETNYCVTIQISCVCGIMTLPTKLINCYIPDIEPKC